MASVPYDAWNGTTRSSHPMRAVESRSSETRCRPASGIHNTVVYSCRPRKARLLPSQSSTEVRSVMPVTSAIASAAYELSPATRARTHKNWSVVKALPQPPGQRVGRAVSGSQLRPQEQRRFRHHLGLSPGLRDDGHLVEAGARWKSGARIDEVMEVTPAALADAAGGRALVAQHQGDAGHPDRPAIPRGTWAGRS